MKSPPEYSPANYQGININLSVCFGRFNGFASADQEALEAIHFRAQHEMFPDVLLVKFNFCFFLLSFLYFVANILFVFHRFLAEGKKESVQW